MARLLPSKYIRKMEHKVCTYIIYIYISFITISITSQAILPSIFIFKLMILLVEVDSLFLHLKLASYLKLSYLSIGSQGQIISSKFTSWSYWIQLEVQVAISTTILILILSIVLLSLSYKLLAQAVHFNIPIIIQLTTNATQRVQVDYILRVQIKAALPV